MALVAMGLGVLVIANDFTALNVALPAIEEDFDVTVGTVAWVINAYALTFGMAIITGGRLADMFGRRRIFFVGAGVFAGFSLLGGFAQSAPELIAMRVGMGIGGALMWPAILGMTFAALPPAKAGLAGGVILGTAGLGNAIGPLVGGALTDLLSWRWIFFVNVPVAAIAVSVTWAKVHQPPVAVGERRIDYRGIAALSLGLLLLMLAFDQSTDWGWGDARVIGMLAAAVVLVATFTLIEPRMREGALIPRDVISNRRFTSACIVVLMMSAVFFTTVLYVPQLMQKVLDYSPLASGVGMLPMLAVFGAVSFVAGQLYERIGQRIVIAVGTACIVAGPLLLSLFGVDSGYVVLVPGLVVTGLGIGLFYPSITTAAVTSLAAARSSLAGGIIYMFQIGGGAVGLALMTAIFTARSQARVSSDAEQIGVQLTDHEANAIHGVLAGTESGQEVVADFPSRVADRLVEIVHDSFTVGVQTSLRVAAGIALAGFVIALLFVRPGPAEGSEEAAPEPASSAARSD